MEYECVVGECECQFISVVVLCVWMYEGVCECMVCEHVWLGVLV